MSLVRGLDANGDWLFGKSLNDYKNNLLSIEQNIATRLSSFIGDCFFAQDAGIDWFNLMGAKNQIAVQLATSATLLNTDSVISINSVVVSLSPSREISVNYSVNTIYGTIVSSVVVPTTTPDYLLDEGGNILTTEGGDSLVID